MSLFIAGLFFCAGFPKQLVSTFCMHMRPRQTRWRRARNLDPPDSMRQPQREIVASDLCLPGSWAVRSVPEGSDQSLKGPIRRIRTGPVPRHTLLLPRKSMSRSLSPFDALHHTSPLVRFWGFGGKYIIRSFMPSTPRSKKSILDVGRCGMHFYDHASLLHLDGCSTHRVSRSSCKL
jgi:hypothetical protein